MCTRGVVLDHGKLVFDGSTSDAVRILRRVHLGELPFDRTVQVSVTDHLEKEQILGRFPHNLRTLDVLLKRNREDYQTAASKSAKPADRREACGLERGQDIERHQRLVDVAVGARLDQPGFEQRVQSGRVCPLGHHDCLRKLSVERVYAAVREKLEEPRSVQAA